MASLSRAHRAATANRTDKGKELRQRIDDSLDTLAKPIDNLRAMIPVVEAGEMLP